MTTCEFATIINCRLVMSKDRASKRVVELTRELIKTAFKRLEQEEEVTSYARKATILYPPSRRIYQVVQYASGPGLIVDCIQFDRREKPKGRLSIHLPETEEAATQKGISYLRGVDPEEIGRIAYEIEEGSKVPNEQFGKATSEYLKHRYPREAILVLEP